MTKLFAAVPDVFNFTYKIIQIENTICGVHHTQSKMIKIRIPDWSYSNRTLSISAIYIMSLMDIPMNEEYDDLPTLYW